MILLLAVLVLAGAPERQVRKQTRWAVRALEHELDVELRPRPVVEVVDRVELANRAGGDRASRGLEPLPPMFVDAARYLPAERRVLVSREAVGALLGEDEGRSRLRALLAHELAHVVAERRWWWAALEEAADPGEPQAVLSALVEGHAQHVAREVCRPRGCEEGVSHLAERAMPPEAAPTAVRLAGARVRLAYTEGESFVATLAGRGQLDAAFAQPPPDLSWVLHPDWYLAGERPIADPRPILGELRGTLGEDWTTTLATLAPVDLAAVLPVEARRASARLVDGAVLVAEHPTTHARMTVMVARLADPGTARAVAAGLGRLEPELEELIPRLDLAPVDGFERVLPTRLAWREGTRSVVVVRHAAWVLFGEFDPLELRPRDPAVLALMLERLERG